MHVLAATGSGAAERLAAARPAMALDHAEDVAVAGDAQAVAEAVGRLADAAADTVVLQPTADDPTPGLRPVRRRDLRPLVP